MPRAILLVLLLLLLALGLAGSGAAQSPPDLREPGLDDLKYRAIHGRPPPPPEAQPKGEAKDKEGQEAGQEAPKPRYRWGNDPLLTPQSGGAAAQAPATPGSPAPASPAPDRPGAPAVGAAPPAGSNPAAPYPGQGLGGLSGGPPGGQLDDGGGDGPPSQRQAAPGSVPARLIVVQVVDGAGRPISQARISVIRGDSGQPRGGYTDDVGVFRTRVPCYQPGREGGLVYRVQVVSGLDLVSQVVETDRYNCGQGAHLTMVLEEGQRERAIQDEYRRRQFLYQQEDLMKAPKTEPAK